MQAHTALQLAPSGSIAGLYAMRSHVGSQAYIFKKKRKKKTSCCAVVSCQAKSGDGKLNLSCSKLKNASYSNKYILHMTLKYFLIVELMY